MYSDEEEGPDGTEFLNYPLSFLNDIVTKPPMPEPFDASLVLSDNPFSFGPLGTSSRIGRWVRFHGGKVSLNGKNKKFPETYGQIIGDKHDRIVVTFEGLYLGWINPDKFEIIATYEFPQDALVYIN